MSNRLKGKALPQPDPHRKPKKNRHMTPRRVTTKETSSETRGGVYGGGIIRGCLIGLAFWFVAWLVFC